MVMRLLKGDGKKKDRSEDPILKRVREDGIFGQDINDMKSESIKLPKPVAKPPVLAQPQLPQDQRQAILTAAEAVLASVDNKSRGWTETSFVKYSIPELQKLSDALKILEKHGDATSALKLSEYLNTIILRKTIDTSWNPWSQGNKASKMQERIRRNITQAVEEIALREPNEYLASLAKINWSGTPPLLYLIAWENFDKFKACPSYPDFAKKVLDNCSQISSMTPTMQEIHIRLQKKIAGVD